MAEAEGSTSGDKYWGESGRWGAQSLAMGMGEGKGLLDLSPWGCMRTGSEVGVQGERTNSRSPIFLKKIILI